MFAFFLSRDMNQKLRDDKDAIEAAHEAVSPVKLYKILGKPVTYAVWIYRSQLEFNSVTLC